MGKILHNHVLVRGGKKLETGKIQFATELARDGKDASVHFFSIVRACDVFQSPSVAP